MRTTIPRLWVKSKEDGDEIIHRAFDGPQPLGSEAYFHWKYVDQLFGKNNEKSAQYFTCADCGKHLMGAFWIEGDKYKCAKCTIRDVEEETNKRVIGEALTVLNEILKPGHRPLKSEIREAAMHLRSLLSIRKM